MNELWEICKNKELDLDLRWSALRGLMAMRWRENQRTKKQQAEIRRIKRRRQEERQWKQGSVNRAESKKTF